MTNKLYKLMDWAAIEAIVYSEEDDPHKILGIHAVTGGKLAQGILSGGGGSRAPYQEQRLSHGTGG